MKWIAAIAVFFILLALVLAVLTVAALALFLPWFTVTAS
jgi:hypothetical protein